MSKAKSADLLMKLYDLRREATMREAPQLVHHLFSRIRPGCVGCYGAS